LVKVYATAQIALHQTLTSEPAPKSENPPAEAPSIPPLLLSASLRTVALSPTSQANGRLIRELQLRRRSGASIVGIERSGGESILNPGPDEEALPGDHVLLICSDEQRRVADTLLSCARLLLRSLIRPAAEAGA